MVYIPVFDRDDLDPDYAGQVRAFVEKTTSTFPPFTPEQRARLAVLLSTTATDIDADVEEEPE